MKKNINKHLELCFNEDESCFIFSLFGTRILGSRITAKIGKQKAMVTGFVSGNGRDSFGEYEEFVIKYVSPKNNTKRFTGTVKVYEDFLLFEYAAQFEIKGKNKKNLFGNPYISFPCFEGEFADEGFTMHSFKRQVPFNFPVMWNGRITDSFREGKNVPLIAADADFRTLVISPLSNLLYGTVSITHFPPSVRCGIPRALKLIPEGTAHSTVVVLGQGINATIDRWGEIVRRYNGTGITRIDDDVSLKYISYWTNAGSAYWYNSYRKGSYESTLGELKAHHEASGLNFGSYQLDSWWYHKDGDDYTSGITQWEPKSLTLGKNFNSLIPSLQRYRELPLFFSNRLSHVQSVINKPIGCHFKQLSNESVYVRKNGEDFICEEFAMPKNREAAVRLFRQIFTHPQWRLAFVVHDWLQWMNDRHSAFRDFFAGPEYFEALDQVSRETPCADNACGHLTMHLCMTQPHMTMNSASMPSVTCIRSTSDSQSFFVEGATRWWWHLNSSRFIQAMGKYAFYDNRLTMKRHTHPFTSYPKLEVILLGLSCGPIGIGDPIGKENAELIWRAAMEDGEIIKPDFPAVLLDKCYLYNPHALNSERGVTVYSASEIGCKGNCRYSVLYILTMNIHPLERKVEMEFSLREAGAVEGLSYALYDYFSGDAKVVLTDNVNSFAMRRKKFFYHVAAPVMNGIGFLGDSSKHVTCSSQLVQNVCFTESGVKVKINKKARKMQPEPVWIFYCADRPKEVLADGSPAEMLWKDGILKIRKDAEKIEIRM